MLYATHLVSMLHPEPAWIDPSGVLKYTSSTYAIIFFCEIYETAGFNRQKYRKQRFGSVLLFFDGHVTHGYRALAYGMEMSTEKGKVLARNSQEKKIKI